MKILRNKDFFHHLKNMVPDVIGTINVNIEMKSDHIAILTVDRPVKNTAKIDTKTYLVTDT